MMLRLPSLREIVALFVKPTSVDHAVAGIQAAVNKTEAVIAHGVSVSDRLTGQIDALYQRIDTKQERQQLMRREVERAGRVADRLRELVS